MIEAHMIHTLIHSFHYASLVNIIQLSLKKLKQTHQSKQSRSFQFGHPWGYELEKSKVENCGK